MLENTEVAQAWRVPAAVAAGGTAGAVLRWAVVGGLNMTIAPRSVDTVAQLAFVPAFPWGTLAVNLVGALLLGILAGRAVTPVRRAFLGTGLLGSFTTFSAFAVESVRIADAFVIQGGRPFRFDQGNVGGVRTAGIYVVLTLVVGLLAARVGLGLGRGPAAHRGRA